MKNYDDEEKQRLSIVALPLNPFEVYFACVIDKIYNYSFFR